jgi:hypothetical protein
MKEVSVNERKGIKDQINGRWRRIINGIVSIDGGLH